MRFAFIAAKKAEHRVTILCRCMRVTRSGFYAWARRGLSARARRDVVLRTKLRAFHAASGDRYGRPRLWKDLKEDGEAVSEKRFIRTVSFRDSQFLASSFCPGRIARGNRADLAPFAFLHSRNYFSCGNRCHPQNTPLHLFFHCGLFSAR